MLREVVESLLRAGREQIIAEKTYEIIEIDGAKYSHSIPQKIKEELYSTVRMTTLNGVVDYIRSGADAEQMQNTLICHVVNEKTIRVSSEYNSDRTRHIFIESEAFTPSVILDRYMPLEEMVISLQALFLPSENRDAILCALSSVKQTDSAVLADDGISQKVTIEKGDELFDRMTIPNPVHLAPYRTFVEIDQPESPFVLRLKEGQVALFESDGGRWKIDARQSIKEFLTTALAEHENVKILL